MKRYFPWIVLLVMAAWIASSWRPVSPNKGDFDIAAFGKTPVLVGGRVKPLDTVGRNSLLIIHGKQQLKLEGDRQLNAMEWLTDVLFNAQTADDYPLFLVQNAEVLGLFGWEQTDRKYFSFAEFAPFLQKIDQQGEESEKLESVQRSAYQNAILNLRNALVLYQRLKNSVQPADATNFSAELQNFVSILPAAGKAASQRQTGEQFDKSKLDDVAGMMQRYGRIAEFAYILAVPPANGEREWHSVGDSLLQILGSGGIHPVVREYAAIGDAYRGGDRGAG